MKRLGSKFVGLLIGLLFFAAQVHAALVCPSPNQPAGTAWCDGDPSRFLGDALCVAEPVGGTSGSTIDEETVGAGVCILGKFKDTASVQKLADFIVSYDFPADPLMGPSGVFVPDLATLVTGGEFMTTVPLEDEGVYDVTIQGRVVGDDGSFQDISILRRVLRVAQPHLTVTGARIGGSTNDCSATDPSCFGVHGVEGDSDGDGICDGPMPIPGVCTAGPDPSNDAVHAVELTPPAQRARSVELCVNTHDDEASAGNSVLVRAVNTITDDSATPAKEFLVEASCAAAGETVCQPSTDSFCPGGFKVNVPLGNGKNDIELFVSNLVTGYDIGAGERVKVKSFDADLKGPALCVNYLNQAGHKIDNADGKAILQSEASSVTVDVTLGTCDGTPETVSAASPDVCDANNPPDCGSSPVCVQRNDEKAADGSAAKFVAMCPSQVNGKTHYQAAFSELRFPLNTALIKAADDVGNQTAESHSFGYGNVRPLFNDEGRFEVKKAVIPNGIGGFVSADYVKNEVLPVILSTVNSKKFKNDFFFKLLDPHQPSDEEISCLKSIEDSVNCTFDHLASKARTTAIKFFCDGDCQQNLGDIEIPSLYFLNQNRLRLQLKLKGMHGLAEMYTMQFIDSDHDGIVDTEDDDADNDGICDHFVMSLDECKDENHDGVCDAEVGLTGSQGKGLSASAKCVLDKTIAQRDCPDPEVQNVRDYFGCSDQDDDNDGVPDDKDLPGLLVQDPDFNTFVIPLKFAVKELALNLEIQFNKSADGRLHFSITNAPGRDLVEFINDDKFPIEFDCDKDVSQIYGGGGADDPLNGHNAWTGGEVCRALDKLNPTADQALFGDKKRGMQSTRKQLQCTVNAIARCSLPKRIETTLDKYENDKLAAISVKVLDNRFHLDLFAPLGSATVNVDPRGLGFAGGGLLVPAGVSDPNDTAERNSKDFLGAVPEEFKNAKFGPLSPATDMEPVDPIEAAFQEGKEVNLAIAEETVNSVLHSAGLLLWDLAKHEGEVHQTLDMTAKKLREKFDLGIPDIGSSGCKDKNGDPVADDSYKCFPFPLNIENVIGPDTITYVDFDGDGVPGSDNDKLAPVLIRTVINPESPPTARIVSVSPIQSWDGSSSPSNPAVLMMEVEVGLNNVGMSLFEEKVADWHADVIKGTGEIKDWCDSDRYPGADQTKCDGSHKLPMVTFNASGRVFATVLVSVKDKAILRLEGGLSSVERAEGATAGNEMDLDRAKTYLNFTVAENNTIVPDNEFAAAFKRQIDLILPKYVFGNARDIRGNIPAQLPLEAYCAVYKEDSPDFCDCVAHPDKADCDLAHTLQRVWERVDPDQYGIEGMTLDRTVLGVTADDLGPRYLTLGADTTIQLKK